MQKLGVSMYLYNLGVLNEEVFVQQPLNLVNSWGTPDVQRCECSYEQCCANVWWYDSLIV